MSATKKIWPKSAAEPLGPNPFYNGAKTPRMVPKFKPGEELAVLRCIVVNLQSIMRQPTWSPDTLDDIARLMESTGVWVASPSEFETPKPKKLKKPLTKPKTEIRRSERLLKGKPNDR